MLLSWTEWMFRVSQVWGFHIHNTRHVKGYPIRTVTWVFCTDIVIESSKCAVIELVSVLLINQCFSMVIFYLTIQKLNYIVTVFGKAEFEDIFCHCSVFLSSNSRSWRRSDKFGTSASLSLTAAMLTKLLTVRRIFGAFASWRIKSREIYVINLERV